MWSSTIPMIVNTISHTITVTYRMIAMTFSVHARLLIGAPKAQYNGLEEGGVYVCPLVHQATCKRNEAFNSRDSETKCSEPTVNSLHYLFRFVSNLLWRDIKGR